MKLIFDIKSGPIMLRSSELCYEICRQRSRTDKDSGTATDLWEPYLYPATLANGINRIIDMKIKASDSRTLAELKTVVEAARDEVCRVWNTDLKAVK